MKRYPPHDPPEYIDWTIDPEVLADYRRRVTESPRLLAALDQLGPAGLERIYRGLVRTRLYDITLKRWVRTGVLTKAWLGLGEEGVTIGALSALEPTDVVGPMIRNQAAAFEKGIPLVDCFRVYLATGDTITQGRDLHIGDLDHHVVSPISHVGDLVPVLSGFALAFQRKGEDRVALTWTGEGATRTGAVHEGLALAADLRLPLITIVQDNHVALGTKRTDRFQRALRATADGHGILGLECEGNHVLDVHATVREARERCLAGEGPVVIYTRTFRMGGHATHDEAEARRLFPSEDFAHWGQRDPVGCFEAFLEAEPRWLIGEPNATASSVRERLEAWEREVYDEIEAAAAEALESRAAAPPDPSAMAGEVIVGGPTPIPE